MTIQSEISTCTCESQLGSGVQIRPPSGAMSTFQKGHLSEQVDIVVQSLTCFPFHHVTCKLGVNSLMWYALQPKYLYPRGYALLEDSIVLSPRNNWHCINMIRLPLSSFTVLSCCIHSLGQTRASQWDLI